MATVCVALLGQTAAGQQPERAQERPTGQALVIRPGHEAAISALVAPPEPWEHAWRPGDVRIAGGVIEVGAGVGDARVLLSHPHGEAPDAEPHPGWLPRRAGPLRVSVVGPGWRDATLERRRAVGAWLAAVGARADLGLWTRSGRPVSQVDTDNGGAAAALDPALWFILGLIWLLAAVFMELPDGRRRETAVVLLVAVAVGLAWRLAWSPRAPMTAWAWARQSPLPLALSTSPALLRALGESTLWFDDLVSWVHLGFAVVTPLALYVHGAALLRDQRAALLAALLVACSPHHIRFSASDVVFVPSLVLSSSVFIAVYGVARTGPVVWRVVCGLALLPLAWLALEARPLNLLFVPLWVASAGLVAREGRARTAVLVGLSLALLGAARVAHLAEVQGEMVSRGLSWATLRGGLGVLLRPSHNPILAWSLTPPVWTGLVLVGVAALVRRARWRAVLLLVWLVGFVVAHGVVVPEHPGMNARYQLHAAAPMALLAGVGGVWVAQRRWLFGLMALVVLLPSLHGAGIRENGGFLLRERAFAERMRDRLPDGCVVLERLRPLRGEAMPRAARVGMRVGGPAALSTLELADDGGGWKTRRGCLAFYEGVACHGDPVGPARDALCAAVLRGDEWRLLTEERFVMRSWDSQLAGHLRYDGEVVALRLWRRVRSAGGPRR